MPETLMLVGDKFYAECKDPNYIKNNYLTKLKYNAFCKITNATSEEELTIIKLKYKMFKILFEVEKSLSAKILLCFNSFCNLKHVHDSHTGADKVKPFEIVRIEIEPLLCIEHIYATLLPSAEVITINQNV